MVCGFLWGIRQNKLTQCISCVREAFVVENALLSHHLLKLLTILGGWSITVLCCILQKCKVCVITKKGALHLYLGYLFVKKTRSINVVGHHLS